MQIMTSKSEESSLPEQSVSKESVENLQRRVYDLEEQVKGVEELNPLMVFHLSSAKTRY